MGLIEGFPTAHIEIHMPSNVILGKTNVTSQSIVFAALSICNGSESSGSTIGQTTWRHGDCGHSTISGIVEFQDDSV